MLARTRVLAFILLLGGPPGAAAKLVPASHPYIQYYGRWDLTDSLHPRFSWPGVYIRAEFTGKWTGIRLIDRTNYYNVYIDGRLRRVFHGEAPGEAEYVLADSLENGQHALLLSRRNITFDEVYTFCGFVIDDSARILPPAAMPERKMEFIGDSFTAAESNEATVQELPWEARIPVTNIDKGFAAIIARHFGAQYQTICRSGSGMLCDWQGNRAMSIPKRFDRVLMDSEEPKWDFRRWLPDVAVVCLGLNDYSGLKEKDGSVSPENSALFRDTYHAFLSTLRTVSPGVRIVCVSPPNEWIRSNVYTVVEEERSSGQGGVFYAQFDRFETGYVANGHPTVATHQKIAEEIIASVDTLPLFPLR